MLSIGTGWVPERLSLARQKSPGLFARFSDALDWNLSGERQYKELLNFTPAESRHRYHRIDLKLLDIKEPRIDEVAMIDSLKLKTESMLVESERLPLFLNSWFAALFVVKMQAPPVPELTCFRCNAVVFCRENLTQKGTKALYEKLKRTGAYFLVNDKPVICTKNGFTMPFKCTVEFTVDDLSNNLFISLGMTGKSERWPISGLPRPLNELIRVQGLNCGFGRSDHEFLEESIRLPLKRSCRRR
jgi:hypothetical protein